MDEERAAGRPRKRFPFLNLLLFLATIATTLLAGGMLSMGADEPVTLTGLLVAGIPFSASIMGILFCHEMGHYLMARAHGVSSTLPFFIPFLPFPMGFGTLGAIIRIRSCLPTRRAVLDIGAAGPIAGFVVAFPLLIWGYAHSTVEPYPALDPASSAASPFAALRRFVELLSKEGSFGSAFRHFWQQNSEAEVQVWRFGDSVITWLVQHWTVGAPPSGYEVVAHPVALAAWLGLFVTMLNLIPLGQLDGGHVTYALLGRERAHRASRWVSAGLLLSGFFISWSWFAWWAVTRFLVGLRHPPALSEEPLDRGRSAVAIASLVLFFATFVPMPFGL